MSIVWQIEEAQQQGTTGWLAAEHVIYQFPLKYFNSTSVIQGNFHKLNFLWLNFDVGLSSFWADVNLISLIERKFCQNGIQWPV